MRSEPSPNGEFGGDGGVLGHVFRLFSSPAIEPERLSTTV